MLIYMFYVLPFFCLCIYGLVLPGCSWLPDWSLVFAGAVAQVRAAPSSFPRLGGTGQWDPRAGFWSQPGESKWGAGAEPGGTDPYPQLHVEQFPPPLPDNCFGLGGS